MREIWNKIIELLGINNAENFVKYTLDDNSKYIEAVVLKDTNFVPINCLKDRIIIALDSVVNNNLKASLLELVKYDP